MKHIFIINPHAGAGLKNDYNLIKENILKFSSEYDIEVFITKKEKDATNIVKKYLNKHSTDTVRFYSCGGDGTLNEVINGIIGYDNASVSVYPCGSGNDFVKSIGKVDDYLDVKSLLNAENKKIDVLVVNDDTYCINVCNCGFDAIAAKHANFLKNKGKKNSYTRGVIKALFCGMKNKITFEIDGEVINSDGNLLLSTVANGNYYGGKYKCAPNAKIDDGKIDACIVRPVSIFTLIKLIKLYELGGHIGNPKFEKILKYKQCESVRLYSNEEFVMSVDGEIISSKEFKVKILKNAINFGIL